MMNPTVRLLCATLMLGSLACGHYETENAGAAGGGAQPSPPMPDSSSPRPPSFPDTSMTPAEDGPSAVPSSPPTPDTSSEPPPIASDAGTPPDAPAPTTDVPAGPCCSAHVGSSCVDDAVTACVCAADPRCCSDGWDEVCVTLVAGLGCGECKTDCCAPSATGGCAEPSVERCVCDKAPECCTDAWDDFCVLLASSETASGACGQCVATP